MLLNTTQTNTVLTVLTKFIQSKDTFTIDNIIKIIKDSGDYFNGFYDDKGDCIVDEYITAIEDVVDHIILNLYTEVHPVTKKVYVFEKELEYDEEEKFDEIINLEDEEEDTDLVKPAEGREEYTRPQIFDNMNENMEDEQSDPDADSHRLAYGKIGEEVIIDNQKRITLSKEIVKEAEFEQGDEITILQHKNSNESFILLPTVFVEDCVDESEFNIIKRKVVVKKSIIRIGIGSIIKGVKPGESVMVRVNVDYNTKLKHILIYI